MGESGLVCSGRPLLSLPSEFLLILQPSCASHSWGHLTQPSPPGRTPHGVGRGHRQGDKDWPSLNHNQQEPRQALQMTRGVQGEMVGLPYQGSFLEEAVVRGSEGRGGCGQARGREGPGRGLLGLELQGSSAAAARFMRLSRSWQLWLDDTRRWDGGRETAHFTSPSGAGEGGTFVLVYGGKVRVPLPPLPQRVRQMLQETQTSLCSGAQVLASQLHTSLPHQRPAHRSSSPPWLLGGALERPHPCFCRL